MIPQMNPRQMQSMMKRMGIAQSEIDATQVVIVTKSGKIVIENPSVVKVNMMGQETFQISGDIQEEKVTVQITQEDIQTVIAATQCTPEQAKEALEQSGADLAGAIVHLQK
jgi:nascent polypeptide-associated complex subunit alpha